MKTTRLILTAAALTVIAATSYAPDFAVLLGGGSGDSKSKDGDHRNWINVQSVAWTAGVAKDGAAGTVGAPAPADKAKSVTRREFAPVVITIPAEGKNAALKKAFTKGRKLGTIQLRDGARVLVLHGVTVASVSRNGDSESVSLNYTKIENANVPERAKEKIKAGEQGRAPD